MLYTLLSVAILLISLYLFAASVTPPNPPADDDEQVGPPAFAVRGFTFAGPIIRGTAYANFLLEAYGCWTIGSGTFPGALKGICQSNVQDILFPSGRLSSDVALGCALITIGGAIRLACFREMGRMFTWEISLRKSHELITSGPYSIVRHPSYTGNFCVYGGQLLLLASRTSILQTCLAQHYPFIVRSSVAALGMTFLYICVFVGMRSNAEDALMKKEFGKKWEQWAAVTKYRFVPYVF